MKSTIWAQKKNEVVLIDTMNSHIVFFFFLRDALVLQKRSCMRGRVLGWSWLIKVLNHLIFLCFSPNHCVKSYTYNNSSNRPAYNLTWTIIFIMKNINIPTNFFFFFFFFKYNSINFIWPFKLNLMKIRTRKSNHLPR